MPHEDQLALRTWAAQIEQAMEIATAMGKLPRYGLLGITKMTVLRLALADGIEVIEQADPMYLRKEKAQELLATFENGILTKSGLRLPIINSFNVMLTPEAHADELLAQGIVDLHSGKSATGKEALVNIRLPRALKQRMEKAARRMSKAGPPPSLGSTSAAIRLMLDIGLFWMDYKVYWTERSRAGRVTDAPTPLP